MILIIDFGSQTTHLIGRRIQEMGVKTKIVLPEHAAEALAEKPTGIILSGGPASVYEDGAPLVDEQFLMTGIPVLGICYGHQLLAQQLTGGKVKPGKIKEFGPALLQIHNHDGLFKGVPPEFTVWMNHGDEVAMPPLDAKATAVSGTINVAAMEDPGHRIYGVQFHPEVVHTQFGDQILQNFLTICGESIQKQELNTQYVETMIQDIRDSVLDKKAICALSGGVDSSVAALLVHKAIGSNLTSVYIDSGLMRHDETKLLTEVFKKHYDMPVTIIDAKHDFVRALAGVTDPETKRKIIGKTFIELFEREAEKIGATFLVQGTIYPDVIESMGTKHSKNIKSHHNVGGLPEEMKFTLIEPLRAFYKDQVRTIGSLLELPNEITQRQPFPGPGLAIRIIGEVTHEKLDLLRHADAIVRDEIEKSGIKLWQAFAIYTGIKTTGVRGDNRAYGDTIALRAIEATDAMSAHWAQLPYELLDAISTRIVNEIPEVNRIVYDISNKPPATMEWE